MHLSVSSNIKIHSQLIINIHLIQTTQTNFLRKKTRIKTVTLTLANTNQNILGQTSKQAIKQTTKTNKQIVCPTNTIAH